MTPRAAAATTAAHFALRHPGEVRDMLAALARTSDEIDRRAGRSPMTASTRAEEGLRETLTSTGNGYICMRGAAEWASEGDVRYPGTYTHGVYNRETTIMAGDRSSTRTS